MFGDKPRAAFSNIIDVSDREVVAEHSPEAGRDRSTSATTTAVVIVIASSSERINCNQLLSPSGFSVLRRLRNQLVGLLSQPLRLFNLPLMPFNQPFLKVSYVAFEDRKSGWIKK